MASDKKKHKKLVSELQEARAAHEKLLKRVDKARKKYDRRATKLHALEQEIAHLEQHYYAPEAERMGQAAPEQDAARPAALIYGPNAGESGDSTQKLTQWVQCLRTHGIAAQVSVMTTSHSARDLVREALDKNSDLVIVAGDDETIEQVARELVGSKTTLAILPTGAENNLAQALGIPTELDPACALIGMGTTRSLDAGQVIDSRGSNEVFFESISLGDIEDGSTLPHALRHYDIQVEQVQVELATGEVLTPPTRFVTVSNAPLMGPDGAITPDARMDDGLLDIGVYEGMNAQEVRNFFSKPVNQSATQGPKFYRARRVQIQAANTGTAEAETTPAHSFEIKVSPDALATIVGKGNALALPMTSVPAAMQDDKRQDANGNGKNKPSLPLFGLFQR